MKKVFLLSLLSFLFIAYSCTKEELDESFENEKIVFSNGDENPGDEKNRNSNGSITRLNPDDDFRNLTRVLSIAVNENSDFRSLIKTEALIQFDGDYDVLINTIKDKEVITSNRNTKVKLLLGRIYDRLGLGIATEGNDLGFTTSPDVGTGGDMILNPDDIIDYLVAVYPIIQVAVPEHAEDWDDDNYVPIVTFIPEDYNEGETDFFDGYLNDNHIPVDAVTPPIDPVLVVGLCERKPPPPPPPPAPLSVEISLSAIQVPTGIKLSWTIYNPNDDDIWGYRVYRKKPTPNSPFQFIAENIDEENNVFYDINIDPSTNYSYYVKAYNVFGESEKSNSADATSPAVPEAVADFSALHLVEDQIELRWIHEDDQYILNTTLFEQVVGEDLEYLEVGTFPLGTNVYFDNEVLKGKRVNYQIKENNYQGSSSPSFDFVQVPYRDVSEPAPVRIHRITYNEDLEGQIEGWGRGRPEFRVAVVRGLSGGKGTQVQQYLEFQMDSDNQIFTENNLVLNWLPADWMEVLTFEVIEMDYDPELDKIIEAAFQQKDDKKKNILVDVAEATLVKFLDSDDEEVGKREHRYIDPINSALEFTSGGVFIHLSD